MSTLFKRTKEDFTCEHCGFFVIGDGYTNHCPKCLWAKHVDVNPGDRASLCLGMMSPFSFTMDKQVFIIIHKCEKCGFVRRNKVSPKDDMNALSTIVQKDMQ